MRFCEFVDFTVEINYFYSLSFSFKKPKFYGLLVISPRKSNLEKKSAIINPFLRSKFFSNCPIEIISILGI